MKKIILFFMAILSLFLIGCSQANNASDTIMQNENSMMETEANEMAEIGYEMINGKMMMLDEKTKTQSMMEKEAMLNDGTKVMMDGKIMKSDGTSFMLKEGESIWMDGTFMKAGEMMEDGGMAEKESMMEGYQGKVLAGKTTPYLDFTKEDYDNALKENKIIVLNFYASWCPSCKAEQPEAFAAFNELNDENVIGFRVNYKDYDTDANEEALAKEFGIPYQHTKVILKNGQRVLKSLESWNKQRYLDEIAKVQ